MMVCHGCGIRPDTRYATEDIAILGVCFWVALPRPRSSERVFRVLEAPRAARNLL